MIPSYLMSLRRNEPRQPTHARRGARPAATIAVAVVALVQFCTTAIASTIRIHDDVGWGNRIAVRGNRAPLSWSHGVDATWTAGNVWIYSWPDAAGDVSVKPLINDAVWSVGANYLVPAGSTIDIYPFFGPAKGAVTLVNNFWSPQLGNTRTLRIYLPPSYTENSLKRYPVLYMHDGQNLFSSSTAFGGVEWQVDETFDRLIGAGDVDEAIVVGIDNTPDRMAEYTPCCDPTYVGGRIDAYAAFMIDTVKPWIDMQYRTLSDVRNTAVMGSSLGGLASFHIARHRPEVFSKSASMSGSFWWNGRQEVADVASAKAKVAGLYYLDAGTVNDGLPDTQAMHDALVGDGYVQGADMDYFVATGASHNEASWAARLDVPLKYLFPWGSTKR